VERFIEYRGRSGLVAYKDMSGSIDQEDAYFIGYLYGDGGYVQNDGYPFFSVLSINPDVLTYFISRYSPNSRLYFRGKISSSKVTAKHDCYEVRFPSRFSKQFSRFGVFCKKHERRLIGIPEKLFINVLHGLIDSDGFWNVEYRKDCRTPRLRIFITHRSQHFLVDIQNSLQKLFNISSGIYQHGDRDCYRLGIQNTNSCIFLAQKIFNENEYFCNQFKKQMVLNYLDEFVRQKSGELLEPVIGISSQAVSGLAEGSETTWEIDSLNNRLRAPDAIAINSDEIVH
jgi:hypothetical protein